MTSLNLSLGRAIDQDSIMSLYTMNKEFELKEFYGVRRESSDPCCQAKFADVT